MGLEESKHVYYIVVLRVAAVTGILRASTEPFDGKGLKGIFPQLDEFCFTTAGRNFWKIPDALFRISSMTNSFEESPADEYHPQFTRWRYLPRFCLVPDPQNFFEFTEIVRPSVRRWT